MPSRLEFAAQVSFLCRLILNVRLGVLLLLLLWVGPDAAQNALVPAAIVLTALASFMPLWYWDRLAPSMLRRPSFMAADVVVALGLLTLTGAEGPALHFTITTAALAGVLRGYRGAVIVSLTLVAGYELVLLAQGGMAVASFQELIGAPALYPMAASAGASVRVLLERQAATEKALGAAIQTAAAAEERTRLAREMHDSVAKTLHGIAMSALALQGWVGRDEARAAALAAGVAQAARGAADEARDLISNLREDRLDVPLDEALQAFVSGWSERTGVEAQVVAELGPEVNVSPGTRYELFSIVKEALRNVERHARASGVQVALSTDEDVLSIVVVDDGVGFERPCTLEDLASHGHYGVVGMSERAQRVGGRFEITSGPQQGTRIEVSIPLADASPEYSPSSPDSVLGGLTA